LAASMCHARCFAGSQAHTHTRLPPRLPSANARLPPRPPIALLAPDPSPRTQVRRQFLDMLGLSAVSRPAQVCRHF
jgi:hypothetical protein